jgi:excisionase family DNA binding protein
MALSANIRLPDKETQNEAVVVQQFLENLSSERKQARTKPKQLITLTVDEHHRIIAQAFNSALRARIPDFVLSLLQTILAETAKGNAVTVMPVGAEVTTQQAAEFLNVSRPHVIKLIKEGKLPHRMVGSRRKVLFDDLKRFKQVDDAERRKVADSLTAEAQALGLYD